jgi:hypothetical protein
MMCADLRPFLPDFTHCDREPISSCAVLFSSSPSGLPKIETEPAKMCEACEQLDEKIGHYKKVISAMTDQLTIDRITALVAELEARKAKLHRSRIEPHL